MSAPSALRYPQLALLGAALSTATLVVTTQPAVARNTPTETANKALVLDFYEALNAADAAGDMKSRVRSIAEAFLSPNYVQHSASLHEGQSNGITAREEFIQTMQAAPAQPKPYQLPRTLAVMAEDDRVMLLIERDGAGRRIHIFNMFRIEGGKLVEHWSATDAPLSAPIGVQSGTGG